MSDDTKRPGQPEGSPGHVDPAATATPETSASNDNAANADAPPAPPPANGPAGPAEETAQAADESPNDPEIEIDKLRAQIDDLTDRLLRAHAETQNLHRRLERDIEDASKYAITKFARDIVAVADNFERAITAVPADATADNPVLKSLLEGFTMTEREFLNVLERHKVMRLSPAGEAFDPHKHQAMMEQEDRSVPAGTVLQVFQPGYEIDDRVLRPALVVVAKGGPKPVKSDPADGVSETSPENAAPDAPGGTEAPEPSPSDDSSESPSRDQTTESNGNA